MERFISKRLKRSAVYNKFLELLEHYNEELQDLDFSDFVYVCNGVGGDLFHLISKNKVMVAYYNDEAAKYNDIWVYISANGNEVYIKAKEIDCYDIINVAEQIHMKCYDYDFGPSKEGECTLKYEKFGGPDGRLLDQSAYHYDINNNPITSDINKYLTVEACYDGVNYSFSGIGDELINELLNGKDEKKKKKEW